MKLNKCHFCKIKLVYLGHLVTQGGIQPDPAKTSVIEKMLPPVDIHGLRRFIGLCSYYSRFVEGFSKIAEPLNALLRKHNLFKWDEKCDTAFKKLKEKLVKAPILSYPNFSEEMILFTDASTIGIGGILAQKINGQEKVIAYASRTLNSAERNYTITELECLAIVWAVNYFRPYLYGKRFLVITDHFDLHL